MKVPKITVDTREGLVCLKGHKNALLTVVDVEHPNGKKEVIGDYLYCPKCEEVYNA